MSVDIAVSPSGLTFVRLVAREPLLAAWIERQADEDGLRDALAQLAGVPKHRDRSGREVEAARRLTLRAYRRLGELLGPAMTPRQAGSMRGRALPDAERKANSRARALAAVPRDVFEDELRKPRPSQRRLLGR